MAGFVPPGFEGRFSPTVPEIERPFTLGDAERKARDVLSRGAVKMQEFSDLYGSDVIERDQNHVEKIKGIFTKENSPQEKEAHRLAIVLEAVIYDQINTNQWFGPRAKAIRTTDYDDVINGIDSVVEFKEPQVSPSYLALGIDVTYKHDLSRKFDRIKKEIEKGELATIKYLKTDTSRGERVQVPRLVIAVDATTTHALAKAWFQKAPGLAANPTRHQIISELQLQLEAFQRYAKKVGKPHLAEIYAESKAIIDRLKAETDRRQQDRKHNVEDLASKEIEHELLSFI